MPVFHVCCVCCALHHASQEQLTKLNEERDSVMREVAVLRNDLTTTRAERDRLLTENERMTQEVARIR